MVLLLWKIQPVWQHLLSFAARGRNSSFRRMLKEESSTQAQFHIITQTVPSKIFPFPAWTLRQNSFKLEASEVTELCSNRDFQEQE